MMSTEELMRTKTMDGAREKEKIAIAACSILSFVWYFNYHNCQSTYDDAGTMVPGCRRSI